MFENTENTDFFFFLFFFFPKGWGCCTPADHNKIISVGVWSPRRKLSRVQRAKSLGMEPCITPVKSWSRKDEEKNGKRLNHKKQRSGQLKGGTWLLVLKAAGRPGKQGMGCWMLSREGNYFWLWVMALIHIIFKEYICIFHDEQPESKCWKFAICVETSLL